MVKRRAFIKVIGGALVSWPFAANAQKTPPLPTIGFLGPNTEAVDGPRVRTLVERLRERGWIEGRTVAIEYRWAEGKDERLADIADEFVRLNVNVIVTRRRRLRWQQKMRLQQYPLCSLQWAILLVPAWLRRWRGPGAMS